ncbi:MAG: N-acetyltransferase family protein, partial [Cocleimonas sp.]
VIIAYAYANLWKEREAYKHVLETTVYASHKMTTKGVGTKLYQALFDWIENQSTTPIKSLMGVIALPNDASVALHKKTGFVEAGYFKEVGYKFDQWVDVAFYQKDL